MLDQQLGGHPDRTIGDTVRDEQRALITLDLDFADIRAYPPSDYSGLIVLRLVVQAKPRVLALVERRDPFAEHRAADRHAPGLLTKRPSASAANPTEPCAAAIHALVHRARIMLFRSM